MRIIFAGTPEFAADHLAALIEHGEHQIVGVYTQPDRRSGRGKRLLPSPVKMIAEEAGLPVYQPKTLKDDSAISTLRSLNADIMVVAAYGLLLPGQVLEIPRLGCINIHASLLPRWRGAAPIERAIIGGDTTTGITIMQMDTGLDTGDMLLKAECRIDADETGDSLREKLQVLGRPLLIQALQAIDEGKVQAEKQDDSQSTYANKLDKAEALLDWNESARNIDRKIRAFTSALKTYSFLNGKRLVICSASPLEQNVSENAPGTIQQVNDEHLVVACGEGSLAITEMQLPGANKMDIKNILNGRPGLLAPAMRFSDSETA